MPPERDAELDRLLAVMRQQANRDTVDPDAIWDAAAAAGTTPPPPTDPSAWLELGTADLVLAGRGHAHPRAATSTANALARIRAANAAQRAGPRPTWRWLAAGLLAAATVALTLLLRDSPVRCTWSLESIAAQTTRGGAVEGLEFRVRVRPSRDTVVALFAVAWTDHGLDLQRLHPPTPAVLAMPTFASWPRGPLPAAAATLLPPASMNMPFTLPAPTGYLLLLPTGQLDEAAIIGLQTAFARELPTAADSDAAIEAAVQRLRAKGLAIEWQTLRVR